MSILNGFFLGGECFWGDIPGLPPLYKSLVLYICVCVCVCICMYIYEVSMDEAKGVRIFSDEIIK